MYPLALKKWYQATPVETPETKLLKEAVTIEHQHAERPSLTRSKYTVGQRLSPQCKHV